MSRVWQTRPCRNIQAELYWVNLNTTVILTEILNSIYCRPNTGVSTADWESTEAYTDADCDFTTPQMTYADCAITECAANTLELDCINNKRVVIENGEQVEVSCLDIQYSEWSSCPASCKTRSVSKRYR